MMVPSKEAYKRVQVRRAGCNLSAGVRDFSSALSPGSH